MLAKQGERTVEGFEATGKAVLEWLELEKKAEAGDESARTGLFVAEVRLGKVDPAEARRRMAELELSDAQKAEVEGLLLGAEVMTLARGVGRDQAKVAEAGKEFAAWAKEGKIPAGAQAREIFWYYVARYGQGEKDAGALELALGNLRELWKDNPRAKQFLEEAQAKLEEIRGGK